MRQDKKEAIQLRVAGKSYNEIQKLLGIPKSTLSLWLRDLRLSSKAKHRLEQRSTVGTAILIKRNKQQTLDAIRRAQNIRRKASKKTEKLTQREKFFIGISLYWGEGYKRGADGSSWRAVDFANSDPYLIAFMMYFFRKDLGVEEEKFRIQLMLHDPNKENEARQFWSGITGLPLTQFYKTSYATSMHSQGKRPKKRLPYGTVHIRVNDVKIFFTLIGYIDGLKKSIQLPNKTA